MHPHDSEPFSDLPTQTSIEKTVHTRVGIDGSRIATNQTPERYAPGRRIGQYEIIRELGRGGMGLVFLARDIRLGRRVALKLLTADSRSDAQRFLVEARATARCAHENIVVIHDVGERQGQPYMVLEYVEGRTLREWLQERRRQRLAVQALTPALSSSSLAALVAMILPVVRALEHAHGLGIIHRDLKPSNIILSSSGVTKVVDFGIAKLMHAGGARDAVSRVETAQRPEYDTRDSLNYHTEEITGQGLLLGTRPYMSPEQWNAEEVDPRTDIWSVGVILHEMATGHHPLGRLSLERLKTIADRDVPMPRTVDAFPQLGPLASLVDRCLHKDRTLRFACATDLLEQLETLATVDVGSRDRAPFAGLAAFQEEDASRFFGRDRDIVTIEDRLRHHPLVAVLGPSGAGKSSIVRAGVIPALARSGQRWQTIIVRPGHAPSAALAAGLMATLPMPGADSSMSDIWDEASLIDTWRTQPGRFASALRAYARTHAVRLLLFVDQFEELFTLCGDPAERSQFIACLEGVADDASSPLRVLLSMRSDFLDHFAEHRHMMFSVTRGLVFLPPMDRDRLREALTRPLARTGYRFESASTVDHMLDTLERTGIPLPLLQFTATKLWETRDVERALVTDDSYRRLGGVEGALSAHADAVLASLSEVETQLARALFLRLVTAERTRAVVALDQLRRRWTADARLERVVERLAKARLIAVDSGGRGDGPTIELVHESLIDNWPTLGAWLESSREDAAFLSRLRTASEQWTRQGRPDDLLWRGRAARDAEQWFDGHQRSHGESMDPVFGVLGDHEQRYVRAVIAFANRTRRRRIRWAIAGFVILGAIAVVVSMLAVHTTHQAHRAERQARRADTQAHRLRTQTAALERDAARARNATRMATARELSHDPTAVLALVRDVEPGPLPPGWFELARWALAQPIAEHVLAQEHIIRSAAFGPKGRWLATAAIDSTVRLWDIRDLRRQRVLRGHEGHVYAIAFSPDGTRLLTASADATARIWHVDDTEDVRILRHDARVYTAVFDARGERVVTAAADGVAHLWDARLGIRRATLPHSERVRAAVFSPDGARVATASDDRIARVWNLADGRLSRALPGHGERVVSVMFNPDGDRLVTASDDETARIWDVDGDAPAIVLRGHDDRLYTAVFSPDGTRVATSSRDRTARIWNADGSGLLMVLRGHAKEVNSARFNANGTHVVTASSDRSARIWRLQSEHRPRVLRGHRDRVYAATYSPDGTRIATASADQTVRVWPADDVGRAIVLRGFGQRVLWMAFSPDGERLFTPSPAEGVWSWPADGSAQPTPVETGNCRVKGAIVEPRHGRIAMQCARSGIRIQPLSGNMTPIVWRDYHAEVTALAFSPDGERVAATFRDRSMRVWRVDGTERPTIFHGHDGHVRSVSFSPDGRFIVSGSQDKTARIWNADGSGAPTVLRGHDGTVSVHHTHAFSADGARLVTASSDKSVRLWSLTGSRDVVILRGPDHPVHMARFSPDGQFILSSSSDNAAWIWPDTSRLTGVDDRRLWRASSYCIPIAERVRRLGIDESHARAGFVRCSANARRAGPGGSRGTR